MWQNIAFALIGLPVLILIGWSAKVFFLASDIPLLVRIASGIVGAGIMNTESISACCDCNQGFSSSGLSGCQINVL